MNTKTDSVETIDPRLEGVVLRQGAGETKDSGMCVMQCVAWLAGEEKGGHLPDSPKCACPVVRRFVIVCNDRWNQENRQKLLALVPLIVGSRATREVEIKRGYHFADFAVRIMLPWLLVKAGKTDEAEKLKALAKVTDRATAELARQAARSVRDILRADAYAAAYAAAADADAAAYAAYAAAAAYADAAAYAAAADAAAYARREIADLCVAAIKGALDIKE